MVGNELLHSESIPEMVCEACDAGHVEMGTLSSYKEMQKLKKKKKKKKKTTDRV